MNWARSLDFEDLLKGDARSVYEECGEEVTLALLQVFAGRSIHLRSDVLEAMKRRYIREKGSRFTTQELATRLDVSESFVERSRPEPT
jgi:hypothetical protein